MSFWTLYLLLVKATLTSFSGLASLPVVHRDLVAERKAITDRQLNTAVAIARTTPGPLGLYLVGAGYYAGGAAGAAAGFLAMITPAFLVIPLLAFLGRAAGENEKLRRMIRAVVLASAGLLISASIPMARDGLTSVAGWSIAAASFAVLVMTKVDTLWVIGGAGLAGWLLAG